MNSPTQATTKPTWPSTSNNILSTPNNFFCQQRTTRVDSFGLSYSHQQRNPLMYVSTMARDRVASSSKSCDRFWKYTKLNHIAFAGSLIYIGYLFGSISNDKQISQNFSGAVRDGEAKVSSLRAVVSADANAPVLVAEPKSEQLAIKKDSMLPASTVENIPNKLAYAKGPVIYNDDRRTTSINLLGERHSGTNWITDHLKECVSLLFVCESDLRSDFISLTRMPFPSLSLAIRFR